MESMKVLIVTGGIACGKSSFLRHWLGSREDSVGFCADQTVHELYAMPEVAEKVAALCGREVLTEEGGVDRAVLRQMVFDDAGRKKALEELIHPMVRERFKKSCQELVLKTPREASRWLLADIPLFFEGGGTFFEESEASCDFVGTVAVTCSEGTQVERLAQRNGFDKERSLGIIRSQMPLTEKILLADFVIWNEGIEQGMHRQISLLQKHLDGL